MELRGASNKQLVSHTDRTVRALTTNYLITGVLLEWRLGVVVSVIGRINIGPGYFMMGDRVTGKPSLTNHLGQLSLASLRGR